MAGNNENNTVLNLAHTIGSTFRDIIKGGVKTQVVALDAGGAGAESLVSETNPLPVNDFWMQHAIDVINADYGDTVSVQAKNKDLLKFGRSKQAQTTKTTLMTLPAGTFNEAYVSSNLINTVSSSSASDTQELVIEGHTISSGVFTFVSQTVTLTGQAQAALTTPLARCTRIYNNGATDLVGFVYVYETDTSTAGVPDTGAKVHCMIDAGLNNSEKASTTISDADYWIVQSFYGDCLEKVATFGILHFEIRLSGKVFRNKIDISVNDASRGVHEFKPYLIIPKNSDIRLRVSASANGKDFSGGIQGALVKVV